MKPNKVQKQQKQLAEAGGNITQTGRDYTQHHSVRVGIWISVTLIAVLAISAAVFFRLLGQENQGIELLIEPPVEQSTEQ